jgi:transketolase
MISQRDAFFNKLFQLAKQDRNIYLISVDMGAPALDVWRLELPSQFINIGVAEQNAIGVATGLAKLGKKIFVYTIQPFLSLRCYEQIKLGIIAHKLPITLVGIGAGFSYGDSGPTHHAIEDISIIRALPGIQITTVTDSTMAEAIAERSCYLDHPNYIRLDREVRKPIYTKPLISVYYTHVDYLESNINLDDGFSIVKTGSKKSKYVVLTCGDMVHEFLDMDITLVDIFNLPIVSQGFIHCIESHWEGRTVVVVEEHILSGGLGSAVMEFLECHNIDVPINRIGIDPYEGYSYEYGGRENLRKKYGLDKESLRKILK